MKKIIRYFIGIMLAFSVLACTDLEENLRGEIIEEIPSEGPIFGGPDYLGSIYYTLRTSGTANHGSYYSIQEITSDEMVIGIKGNDWNSGGNLVHLHRHTYTPDNVFIQNAWINTYSAIHSINEYLSYTTNEGNIIAAKAFRAYFYWRLLDLFGRVKLVTETDQNPPQVSRQEVFDFVERELLEALDIPAISPSMDFSNSLLKMGDNEFVFSRFAALGILAKLYLNAEVYTGTAMYDKAEIAATAIIDSGHYQLCGQGCSVTNLGRRLGVDSDPRLLEGYAAVFASNNDANPEHIFSVNYDEITGGGMNFSQMNLHYASHLSWHLEAQPWNGYATLEEFYNSYEQDDARRKASFLVGPQLDFGGSAILDYQSDDDNIELNYTPEINELYPHSIREAGARPAKFSYQLYGRVDMNNNFPIVRLGEIYLIRAEAKARQSGNWADAEADINILRTRAGVDPYTNTLTEAEFLAELGREMFQETARRTNLIRFGRYNDSWWEKPVSEPFKTIFPIPRFSIGGDPDLTQNPGY